MSRIRRAIPIVIGSGVLGGVVVLYLRSEVLLQAVPDLEAVITEINPIVFLLSAVGILGLAAAAMVLRAKLFSSSRTVENTASRTESSQSLFAGAGTIQRQLGGDFDTDFETATDYGSTDRSNRETARTRTVEELRSLATGLYCQTTGCDHETAEAAVETGEWTTNKRAAGLLADDTGPSIPLGLWVWDLLVGRDPYVNSVDHTLAALESASEEGPQ